MKILFIVKQTPSSARLKQRAVSTRDHRGIQCSPVAALRARYDRKGARQTQTALDTTMSPECIVPCVVSARLVRSACVRVHDTLFCLYL